MVGGILWMAVANAAVLWGTWAVLAGVRTGRAHLDLVLFILIRLALVSASVLVAGLVGALTPRSLGVAGLLVIAGLYAFRRRFPVPRPALGRIPPVMAVFCAVVAVRLLLQVWFFAPYAWDTLSYHLPKVAEWVRAGAITRETGIDPRSSFPAGFELVEIWWTVFLHHDLLIEMAGLEFLALGAAGTYSLAGGLGAGTDRARLAALLYAMTPGIHFQATSCLNDGPVAALWVAAAALVWGRVHPGLLTAALGLGVGVKPTFAYALPGILLLWFLVRREPPAAAPRRLACAALALIGLLAGSFWYGRNAAFHGNPLHPMGAKGAVNVRGEVVQRMGPSLASLAGNLGTLAEERIYDPVSHSALQTEISGWGAVPFACGLPALLLALRTDGRFRRLAAAFGVSLLSVLSLVVWDPWFLRFVLFFPALFAVAVAHVLPGLPGGRLIVWAALLIEFAGTVVPGEFPVGTARSLATQGWREREIGQLPPVDGYGGRVGCVTGARRTYPLYRPDFSVRIVYLRETTADGLLAAAAREGLTVVCAPANSEPVRECVRRGRLRPVVGMFYAVR